MRSLEECCVAALARPAEQLAIEYERRWYAWGELRRLADRLAALLDASGAAADAPVAFVPRNHLRPVLNAAGAAQGPARGAAMRGDFKVLPETIERALMLHPAISAAAVVSVDDARLGQVPAAAVQFKPGAQASMDELEMHLRQHLPVTHVPVHWRFVEALPRTPSMKVERPALRGLFDAKL